MTILYNGMGAKELEAQYNVRARRGPEFAAVVERWRNLSKEVRNQRLCDLDVPYGTRAREKLDWFFSGNPSGPALIYLHGGYWQSGDKSMYSFIADDFVRHGVSVGIVNYDLTPLVKIAHITAQVKRAIGWIWQNAKTLKFARDRLILSGHSAGGHLTGMMMGCDWSAVDHELPHDLIRGAMPISGIFDLQPLVHTTINSGPKMNIEEAKEESPYFIQPKTDAAQLVVVGGGETKEFLRQSDSYVEKYQTKSRVMKRINVADDDHFDVVETLADPNSELFNQTMDLVMG